MKKQHKSYYSENDPYAAQWLRNLISEGLIASGDVDERSIKEVSASELSEYTQHHFFAGIGGWSYSLRLAGWPDNRPIWTGSCPCQPFSVAGQRKGTKDERHLWPVFFELISERQPSTIFGEQVAGKAGREWLAGVRADLEGIGYACGGADLCSAGVGAPNIRQRLYWVADANGGNAGAKGLQRGGEYRQLQENGFTANRLANSNVEPCGQGRADAGRWHKGSPEEQGAGLVGRGLSCGTGDIPSEQARDSRFPWRQSDTVACADGNIRRIEPGSFPLVARLPKGVGRGGSYLETLPRADQGNRQGRIRGYGNAINPVLAAEFIKAFMECGHENTTSRRFSQ